MSVLFGVLGSDGRKDGLAYERCMGGDLHSGTEDLWRSDIHMHAISKFLGRSIGGLDSVRQDVEKSRLP